MSTRKINTIEAKSLAKRLRSLSKQDFKKAFFGGLPASEKLIFVTEEMAMILESRAKAACPKDGNYYSTKTVIITDPNEDAPVAYTDGATSFINALTFMLSKIETKWEYYLCLIYLRLHEQAHVLYTDFAESSECSKRIFNGNFTPEEERLAPKVTDFLKKPSVSKGAKGYVAQLWGTLQNCVEDGFVDYEIVLQRCPGQAEAKACIYKASEDPEWFKNAAGIHNDAKFVNLVLDWSRYRQENFTDTDKSDPAVKAFLSIKDTVTDATRNPDAHVRNMSAWILLEALWSIIEEDAKNQKNQQNGQPGSGEGEGEGQESQEGQQGNSSSSNSSSSKSSKSSSGKSSGSSGQTEQSDPQSGSNSSEQASSSQKDNDGDDEEKGKSKSKRKASKPSIKDMEKELQNLADQVSDKAEEEQNNRRSKSSGSASDKGQPEKTVNESENSKEQSKKDLESLAENKQDENKLVDDEVMRDLTSKDSRPDGSRDRNISMTVERAESSSSYPVRKARAELMPKANILTRKCEAILREITDEYVSHGHYNGRFEANAVRLITDKRVFNKKKLPGELPRWAAGILIDRSGSMSGDNDEVAAHTAFIIYETMANLGFPCFTIGHSATGGSSRRVRIESFADEKSPIDEGDRILNYEGCGGGNRDGYAIRVAVKKLDRINAEKKLLFVISDGAPSAYSGGFEEGCQDCRDAIKTALKAEISPIVAALGGCADSIKRVYKDGVPKKEQPLVLDCEDPATMIKSLTKILKKNICQED